MKFIECQNCGNAAPRRGPVQKYCLPCSELKDQERKRKWARNNPGDRSRVAANASARKERVVEAGKSRTERQSIATGEEMLPLLWLARVKVPFTYAASKNHIYAMNRKGHVTLRKESKSIRQAIALSVKIALRDQSIVQNKLYLDIHVEKPNHRGDAINVVDLVSDAVEDATGLDDRWYSITRLDWSINKIDPMLIIGIGQNSDENVQVCSHCGHLLPYSEFNKAKHNKNGIARACKPCRSLARKLKS